jgi:hypothetical protein
LGDNTSSINSSALFEMESTDKGFLAPRMTAAHRTAIVTPAAGLIVFQTDGTTGQHHYR